jgi:hypothetical protein
MKKYINTIIYSITVICVTFTATSCVDDLNVVPINPQVTQTFKQDDVFAKTYAAFALTGQEGPAGNNDIDITDEGRFSLLRCLWNCNELTTDEAICSWGDAEVLELNTNNWSASNASAEGLYARLYFVVTISNHFLQQTTGMTDDRTVKQRAEVRFLRALAYYYLLDLFGNVPFTEVVSLTPPTQIKRADLFVYIEKELSECETDMYEPRSAPYYRLDKAANWLLRSRLYLNAEVYTAIPASATSAATPGTPRWNDAAVYAKKVMDSGYNLCPTFKHLFMADNAGVIDGSSINLAPQEIIFPIAGDGIKTKSWGASLFLIASTHTAGMIDWGTKEGWGGNRARATLYKKFVPSGSTFYTDPNDLTTAILPTFKDSRALFTRVDRTLNISEISVFKQGFSVIKFSNNRADGASPHDTQFTDMDVPFMRAAEAYLNYAEAIYRNDSVSNKTEAVSVVNTLRARAGAIALQPANFYLTTILDERAREFFFEGYRRTDLIRFGRFGGNHGYHWDWKGGVAAGQAFSIDYNLLPLPAGDLNANSNLKQNPGY